MVGCEPEILAGEQPLARPIWGITRRVHNGVRLLQRAGTAVGRDPIQSRCNYEGSGFDDVDGVSPGRRGTRARTSLMVRWWCQVKTPLGRDAEGKDWCLINSRSCTSTTAEHCAPAASRYPRAPSSARLLVMQPSRGLENDITITGSASTHQRSAPTDRSVSFYSGHSFPLSRRMSAAACLFGSTDDDSGDFCFLPESLGCLADPSPIVASHSW